MLSVRRGSSLALTAKLFRGLGDTSRLSVLAALRDGPLTAGDVVARTRLSQPNTSMHLKCLGSCGLVTWQRDGRFMRYQIADRRVLKLLDDSAELLVQIGPLIRACPRYRKAARAASPSPRARECR